MSPASSASADLHQLQREYTLSLRLLELGQQRELEPFLREALALVVEAVEARQGYLELRDDQDDREARWWIAHGFTSAEVSAVRSAISRGIIAEAMASGQTVITPSAVLDPRWGANESVRRSQIDAVLCAPIGGDPPRGVVYLQGRAAPGLFSPEERSRAEIFARHLTALVDRLLMEHELRQRRDATASLRATLRLDGVVGRSAALAEALKQAALVAPLDVNVLITGGSGTGKTQLARVIHDNSPRRGAPYIEINCATLPDALVENELFGAYRGAHSQADRDKEGKVAAAEGGTLVLDEVAELTTAAQAKVLQLIHAREYFPLGAPRPVKADVRIIAATNKDLKQAVAERTFREDLYYRLHVLPIRMPDLAERREDLPELSRHLCALACTQHNLPHLELSRGALQAIEATVFDGNVRELGMTIQAAAIRANHDRVLQIEASHLFPGATGGDKAALTFQSATRQFHSQFLRRTLQETDWNIVETARRLDLARSHVYNLIKAFGLTRGA
jgi:Nif-specific regulatory protein